MSLKMDEYLAKQKLEIKSLENQIKHNRYNHIKLKGIKNLKIYGQIAKLVYPYILIASIYAGSFKYSGLGLPFYSDEVKNYKNTNINIYNDGTIIYDNSYRDIFLKNSDKDVIKFYGEWYKNDDNYCRQITTYSLRDLKSELKLDKKNLNNLTDDEIKNLFNDKHLYEKFYNIGLRSQQITNDVSLEQLSKGSYIEIKLGTIDKKDYVYEKECSERNLLITLIYIALTGITSELFYNFRKNKFNYYFKSNINNIKRDYQNRSDSVESLKKKLELKKENYNRLKR